MRSFTTQKSLICLRELILKRDFKNRPACQHGTRDKSTHERITTVDAQQAVRLINESFIYPPRMAVSASDNTGRYQGSIKIETTMFTSDSGSKHYPDEWRNGYQTPVNEGNGARAYFTLMLGSVTSPADLMRLVIECLIRVQAHEIREFTRDANGIAPFHPHTEAGISAWGTPYEDLTYGLA